MKLRIFFRIFPLALTVLLLAAGCQETAQKDPYAPIIQTPQQVQGEILGLSGQERPIELLTAGHGEEVILIIATIHGEEDVGTPIVYKLIKVLKQRPWLLESRTVLMMPVANPDGRVLRIRGNAAGIDLNRNFPAPNRINNETNGHAALSEPESQILHDLIVSRKPVRILTIHQPYGCIDYDGPGQGVASRMGIYCDLPVKKLGALPGSLGSFAGVEQNIPTVTMELKESDSSLTAEQLWAQYGPAVLSFITYPESPY